jgi:hypothetical protein
MLVPSSFTFHGLRDDGILQVICPTCQKVFAGSRMPAPARLLCMGLISIFWGREPRRPCGWPAGQELVALAFAKVSFGMAAFTRWPQSFRDGPKDQTRNLEIPGSMLRIAPE